MKWLYNALLGLWLLLIIPKVLYQNKKYRKRFLEKPLSISSKKEGEFRIWIHAVSLGETKAVTELVRIIREERKDAKIFFSSTTETGYKEAKGRGEDVFFLPIDFSSTMKKLVKTIQPDLFILVETDFWYNLLTELKKNQTKTVVVNGKISLRSYKRFKKFPWFSKKLFGLIDLFCLQSDVDKDRFLNLRVPEEKLFVTGNIKFDTKPSKKEVLGLQFPSDKTLITIACTHADEEEMILDELKKLTDLNLSFLLAPRHPERFQKVAELLQKKEISYKTISEVGKGIEQVVLINQMGIMDACFSKSKAAIMGGSFISHIGGHNIYEAARHGIPVLYGPHMHGQESIVNSLKKHNIGTQTTLENLAQNLKNLLLNPHLTPPLETLKAQVEGATQRSFTKIKQIL